MFSNNKFGASIAWGNRNARLTKGEGKGVLMKFSKDIVRQVTIDMVDNLVYTHGITI